jgi:hypothetical protein
LPPF